MSIFEAETYREETISAEHRPVSGKTMPKVQLTSKILEPKSFYIEIDAFKKFAKLEVDVEKINKMENVS